MTQQFESAWWAVEIPSDWIGEREDTCTSFWSENGVGALQLSAFRDVDTVTDADLFDLAKDDLVENVAPQSANCGEFVGITISHITAEKFWRKWWLRKDSLLVYVTYNCSHRNRKVEALTVDDILRTLKTRIDAA